MTVEGFDFKNAVDLADFREGFRPTGSGPLGVMRVAFDLCTLLAKDRGWDLDAALPEANKQRKIRFELEIMEMAKRLLVEQAKKQEKRIKNYIKKHGVPPPTHKQQL